MELSSSNIKKMSYFLKRKLSYIFSKESFSYIPGNGTQHFSAQDRKTKKIQLEIFFYTLGNRNPQKTSYTFSKESFS